MAGVTRYGWDGMLIHAPMADVTRCGWGGTLIHAPMAGVARHGQCGIVIHRRMAGVGGRHLVLHPVIFGAHRDRLHRDGVGEMGKLRTGRWGAGRGHLSRGPRRIRRAAWAAGRRDNRFDLGRADPGRVVVNRNCVGGPVELYPGNRGGGLERLLNRSGTARAMHGSQVKARDGIRGR
jgi:hypothetical protein